MDQVAIDGLILYRIIPIGGGQSFARCSPAHVLLTRVAIEIGEIEKGIVAYDVVAPGDELVIVVNLEDRTQIFWLQTEGLFHLVDAWRARAETVWRIYAMQDERRIQWRFRSPLPFVSQKVKVFLLSEGTANRGAELVRTQSIEARSGEKVLGIQFVVAEEFVSRAVHIVGPGLGNGVDHGTEISSIVSRVGAVYYAEFLHPVLRRAGPLNAGDAGGVIDAVEGEESSMAFAHTSKTQFQHGLSERRL